MDPLLGGWVKLSVKVTCKIGKVIHFEFISQIAYIRGVNGEDLSTIIKSVTFTLHPSFRQNQRSKRDT